VDAANRVACGDLTVQVNAERKDGIACIWRVWGRGARSTATAIGSAATEEWEKNESVKKEASATAASGITFRMFLFINSLL
jgi:hypothetical protein